MSAGPTAARLRQIGSGGVITDLRQWLAGPIVEVAPRLLGCLLSHDSPQGQVSVELTEVEAYDGESDPASHAARGPTRRNVVMYGPAGHLYVYFSYGMHWCANVVVGVEGEAAAVLLRAGRVVAGEDLAARRRGLAGRDPRLARGPACLTQALDLGRDQGGADVLTNGSVQLRPGARARAVSTGPRVGVSQAADVPWRFWVTGDATVSAYRRSVRASVR